MALLLPSTFLSTQLTSLYSSLSLRQRLRNSVERGTMDDIEENTTQDHRQHDSHQSLHLANRAMIQMDDGRPLSALAGE